jgi:hypothetical protein
MARLGGEAVLELEMTAGIGGGDDRGLGGGKVGELAGEELGGLFRLGNVIDSGTAATP